MLSYYSNGGIKLVNGTQAFEDVAVFVESLSSEKRALTLVSCLRVDFHSSILLQIKIDLILMNDVLGNSLIYITLHENKII